jgi:hypothetical protein
MSDKEITTKDVHAKFAGKDGGDKIDPKKFDDVYKGMDKKELFCKKDPAACKDLPDLKFTDKDGEASADKKSGKTLKK